MTAVGALTMARCEGTCVLFPSKVASAKRRCRIMGCPCSEDMNGKKDVCTTRLPTLRTGNAPVVTTRLTSSRIGDAGRVLGADSLATRAGHALGLSCAGRVTSTRACLALSFVGSSLCTAGLAGDDCIRPQALVARGRHCSIAQTGHVHVDSMPSFVNSGINTAQRHISLASAAHACSIVYVSGGHVRHISA